MPDVVPTTEGYDAARIDWKRNGDSFSIEWYHMDHFTRGLSMNILYHSSSVTVFFVDLASVANNVCLSV